MTRVTNLAQMEHTMSLVREVQARAAEIQTQMGSGKKSQEYKGIARDAARLVSLETTHQRFSQYIENNNLVDLRLQSMEGSVSQIFDIASSFKTLLVQGLNANTAEDLNLNDQAQQMLDQVASLLNTSEDGRYLFAGTATDTLPVDLSGLPASYTIPTSVGDSAGYYLGNDVQLSIRADDNFDISYGVTGGDPAFERLIRALDVVVKGAPTDRDMLEHALEVVSEAIDAIPTVRTAIGLDRTSLAQATTKHEDFLLFTEQSISEIENIDFAEAATRFTEAELSLEASYMTLSRLSQTTLLNYLR